MMEEEQVVKALCYLYWSAYHAGHHDTVEGQYTDVAPADRFDYHREAVMECIQGGDMASLGAAIEQARREEREACEAIARTMFNRAATGDEIADAIRARGTLIGAQQQLPNDMADVMRQSGDSLIERGEGK